MKIRPVGTELFHADRRTDMTKLRVVFRNFANASKNNRTHNISRLRREISSKTVKSNGAMKQVQTKYTNFMI